MLGFCLGLCFGCLPRLLRLALRFRVLRLGGFCFGWRVCRFGLYAYCASLYWLHDLLVAKDVDAVDQSVEEVAVVAHDDCRAVEVVDCVFQHVLRLHVEVVGRFVEYEQIDGLEQQLYHSQSATFPARQHFHILVACFASEHEGPEQVAHLGSHVAGRHAVDGVKHCDVAVEQLCLVLCEIAYLHVLRYLQFAIEWYLPHDAFHQCRFSFAVVAHECHFLSAPYAEVHILEYEVVAIAFAYVGADDRPVAAALTWWELESQHRGVDLVDFYRHYFLQLLYSALHLVRFRGFVSESLDEVLDVGYLFLLVLVGTQLLLTSFVAQGDILVVLHAVVVYPATCYLDGACCHVVDKRAVVAHEHHRLGRCLYELLQPLYRPYVEVVGRLVEQQQVGVLQQYLCQLYAHTPSARELARGAVEVVAMEAKSGEGFVDLGLHLPFLYVCAFVCQCCLVEHGACIAHLHHLRQVAHGHACWSCHHSAGGLLFSCNDFQQGRLACSVLSHEGNAVARIDHEAQVV